MDYYISNSTNTSGNYMGNATISIKNNENCIKFLINDKFGDGLNYGEGNWFITWNNYDFYSPSNGNYGHKENVLICNPEIWKNKIIDNIEFIVSFDNKSLSFEFLKSFELIIDKFLYILKPSLKFIINNNNNNNTNIENRLHAISY